MSWNEQGVRHARASKHLHVRQSRGFRLSTLLSSASVAALVLSPGQAGAQSTWQGTTSDYNTATNWTNGAPISGGTSATFDATTTATVTISSPVTTDSWTFTGNAPSYSISNNSTSTSGAVTFDGTGIVDNASGQTISIANDLGGAGGVASRVIRDTLLDHMDHISDRMTVWGAGFAGNGRLASDGNAANLHHNSAGFLAGLDLPVLRNFSLGIDGGYTSNSARTPGSLSAAAGDSGHVGGYAAFNPGNVRFDFGGDYGFGSVNINRAVPALSATASGSQDQQTGQAFADLGYHIALKGAAFEPYAGIAHIVATGGGFAETGGIAALSGTDKTNSMTYTLMGLRADLADLALGDGMALSPRLDLGWQHALAGLTPYQTVSYANAGTSFQVLGTPLAKDAAALQAGFDLKVGASATLSLSYDGSFTPTVENHAFRGGLSWHF